MPTNYEPRKISEEIMVPRRLAKEHFKSRLRKAMADAGNLTQAELSRKAKIKKDSISTYYRGLTLPDPKNLGKLAKALGVETTDLLPSREMEDAFEKPPALELRQAHDDPGAMWLRIDRKVTPLQAAEIMKILSE